MAAALLSFCLAVTWVAWPVAATAQEAPAARGLDRVCPPPDDVLNAADPRASDFPDLGETHGDAITCAAQYDIIAGFADGTVRPGRAVTRGQLASLLARWVQTATGISLPVPDEPAFSDTEGSTHADAIGALASVGIVGGREDGTFGPGDPLTRGQLAATVSAAISFADVLEVGGPLPPTDSEVTFPDVEGTLFEEPIGALAGIGVVQGDANGAYNPDATVTRGQLATFLMRSADYLDRHQRWKPTADVAIMLVRLRADEVVEESPDPDDAEDDDDGTNGDDPDDGSPVGSAIAVLTINAFNGTLAYSLDLNDLQGSFDGTEGATIHLGVAGENGPLAVELADGASLQDADAAVATGVVFESTSAVRFADLIDSPSEVYLQIATAEHPDGAVRGQLGRISTADSGDVQPADR